jgi:hypothetical protein
MRAAAVLAVGLVLVMSTLLPAKRPNDYLLGTIDDIYPADQQIVVTGVTVQVTSETVILQRICSGGGGGGAGEVIPISFDDLATGQYVSVSGSMDEEEELFTATKIMVRQKAPPE